MTDDQFSALRRQLETHGQYFKDVLTQLGHINGGLTRQGDQLDKIVTRLNRLEESQHRAGVLRT
jgi:hypothetical protein